MKHANFYENIQEASMRLRSTFVLYDGDPYLILAITDHNPDGIFRVYLCPAGIESMETADRQMPVVEHGGPYLDQWLKDHPNSPIIRKHMNSPLFNRFRPYPLGMINQGRHTYYLARQPTRNREQGLTRSMVNETLITTQPASELAGVPKGGRGEVNLYSQAFADCVKANHPTAPEALAGLKDPANINNACAFDREFAFVKGPIGLIFVAYKTDVIGVLPDMTLNRITIGTDFWHLREVVESLSIFANINHQ